MKILLLLATVVVATHCQTIDKRWSDFKAQYRKFYATRAIEESKFKIFQENVKFIDNHNDQYRNGRTPYDLLLNKYSDMSPAEYVGRFNGVKIAPRVSVPVAPVRLGRVPTGFSPPAFLDYRNTLVSPAVRDQGECASDWAFVVAASLEAQYAAATSTNVVPLSAQNLLDCTGGIIGNQGCMGGNMVRAFQYFVANGGIATEASYGYTGRTDICRFNPNNRRPTGFYIYAIPPSEDAVKAYLVAYGPVAAAIDASDPKFHFYSHGVYNSQDCSTLNINHAVLIVGYGDELDNDGRAYDYWLVKNSWSDTWGESGYIKILRNSSDPCGLCSSASIAMPFDQ